jgi:hypothetical protein
MCEAVIDSVLRDKKYFHILRVEEFRKSKVVMIINEEARGATSIVHSRYRAPLRAFSSHARVAGTCSQDMRRLSDKRLICRLKTVTY